jgi:predicted RNase H-like nuclease (RuvC/YqgF family)
MHETLVSVLSQKKDTSRKSEEDERIIESNKTLSLTISKMESKNMQLEKKLLEMKKYFKLFKNAATI